MGKIPAFFLAIIICIGADAFGAATRKMAMPRAGATQAAEFVSPTAYRTMYPAMNNAMRATLNPGTTPNFSGNSVSTLTRTNVAGDNRRVVARSARSATTTAAGTRGVRARAATRITPVAANTAVIGNTTESLPAARCMADYAACMNGYCERPDAAYDRCYCSSRLAQIDAQYQGQINDLLMQLAGRRGGDPYTDAEMDEYWEHTIGQYTGDNSWHNIDSALNINWADTDSRVRGQTAFVTGHDYCVQHLRGCAYMAVNMRDSYRSEIARDCGAYETSLQTIRDAAQTVLDAYDD